MSDTRSLPTHEEIVVEDSWPEWDEAIWQEFVAASRHV